MGDQHPTGLPELFGGVGGHLKKELDWLEKNSEQDDMKLLSGEMLRRRWEIIFVECVRKECVSQSLEWGF
jgi:hypothetical protein